MSIKVASYVWEHSKQKGSALLLLLAIADHAHDDGGGAYPSVETLARKIRMTGRNVQHLLRALEQSGELCIDHNAGPNGCNVYRVKTFHRGGEEAFTGGVKSLQGGGEAPFTGGVKPLSPKPSFNRQETVNEPGDPFDPTQQPLANGVPVRSSSEQKKQEALAFIAETIRTRPHWDAEADAVVKRDKPRFKEGYKAGILRNWIANPSEAPNPPVARAPLAASIGGKAVGHDGKVIEPTGPARFPRTPSEALAAGLIVQ